MIQDRCSSGSLLHLVVNICSFPSTGYVIQGEKRTANTPNDDLQVSLLLSISNIVTVNRIWNPSYIFSSTSCHPSASALKQQSKPCQLLFCLGAFCFWLHSNVVIIRIMMNALTRISTAFPGNVNSNPLRLRRVWSPVISRLGYVL